MKLGPSAAVSTWLAACAGAPAGDRDATDDAPTDRHSSAPTVGETGTDTDAPCAEDRALGLTAVAARGPLENQLELVVRSERDAAVAALCTDDSDPGEAHLVEGAAPARSHALRFSGLRLDTSYTCRVAATCPTTGDPALVVHHATSSPTRALPRLEVEVDPSLGMTGHYTVATTGGATTLLLVWGPEGDVRWWNAQGDVASGLEVLLDPGTTALVWGGGFSVHGGPTVVDLWDGEVYKASMPDWASYKYSHDAKRIADGRLLSLQLVPNRVGRDDFDGFGIRLHDQATGAVEFELNSQRYVDEGLLPRGVGWDPYHANWVQWVEQPEGPVLYVGLFYLQQILAVDGRTGDPLWSLGRDLGWTVLDELGRPLDPLELPQGTHGVEVQGDELLVYDNGVERGYTQAARWRIDPTTHTATRLWTWTEPLWNQPWLGDVDDLGDGRVLITQASLKESPRGTRFVEVDVATGRVASRLQAPPGIAGYRGERYSGCDLFAHVGLCPALAERAAELDPLLR